MALGERLIQLRGVHFAYEPGRAVLEDVHLALASGERVGLVGPNGCGKPFGQEQPIRLPMYRGHIMCWYSMHH